MACTCGDKVREEQLDESARHDLEEIERETVAEAEFAVDDFDAIGDERAAAEAAETAQTFEEAERDCC